MNVVDSSAWLEYFVGGRNAPYFAPAIIKLDALLVPSICIVELGRKILKERGEDAWLLARSVLESGTVIPLDAALAGAAATLVMTHRLPLADSIIYATAIEHRAVLWTQDADFAGLPNVHYKPKVTRRSTHPI